MSRIIDMTGQICGRWTVLQFDCTKDYEAYWICKCACGTVRSVNGCDLRSGRSTSCGCYSVELVQKTKPGTKHGLKKLNPRLYRIWQCMLNRCRNKKRDDYRAYGGRGISVCEEWHQFPAFYAWAIANGYADNLTIDRKEVDGNYEPSNCQWITNSENAKKAAEDRRRKKSEI